MASDLVGLGAAAVRLIESGEKFLERLIGPWLDEKGQQLADRVRLQRRLNLATIAGQAQDLVGDQAIHPVPARVLNPLLDAAANEHEPELQQRWAALLANAATRNTDEVIPAYAEILRQLTPVHAAIIDWLYALHGDSISLEPSPTADAYEAHGYESLRATAICERFGLPKTRYNVLASDLHRLQLIDGQRLAGGSVGLGPTTATDYRAITITPLGRAFVRVCTAPAKASR